jgi:hypothetical protein
MSSSEDDHIFTWSLAVIDAEDSGKMHRIVQLLRDEGVPLTILDRRMLADFLEAPHAGRPKTVVRDYDFYLAVESYKITHGIKRLSEETFMALGAKFKLLSLETCRTALKRGRRIADQIEAATRD